MDVRLATTDDLDAIVDLAGVVDPPAEGTDVDRDYYSTVVRHGRMSVAEESGIVVGYTGVVDAGGACQLSDLFVHPDVRSQGLGRRLLDAVWDASVTDVPRQTFSSLHHAALPLYVRAGMRPLWPLLYVEGLADSLDSTHLTARTIETAEAAELDETWFGWDRSDMYTYWSSIPGRRTLLISEGESPVAVACLSRTRDRHTLLRLAAVDRSLLSDAVVTAVRQVTGPVLTAVPGMSAVVPRLLDAGWRIIEHDLYCASEPGLFDAEQLVPHPGLL